MDAAKRCKVPVIGPSADFHDALLHNNVEIIAEGVVGFERKSVIGQDIRPRTKS